MKCDKIILLETSVKKYDMADAGSLAKWYTPCPEPYSDHIYKTAHGVDVGLRVWPAEVEDDAPWLFWIHGGGWAGGYHHRMASLQIDNLDSSSLMLSRLAGHIPRSMPRDITSSLLDIVSLHT